MGGKKRKTPLHPGVIRNAGGKVLRLLLMGGYALLPPLGIV